MTLLRLLDMSDAADRLEMLVQNPPSDPDPDGPRVDREEVPWS